MARRSIFALLLLFSIFLSSCFYNPFVKDRRDIDSSLIDLEAEAPQDPDGLLCQGWELTDINGESMRETIVGIPKLSVLHLFADGSYFQKFSDSCAMGKWTKNAEILHLSEEGNKHSYEIKIASLKPEKMKALIRNGTGWTDVTFESDGIQHKLEQNDPYYPGNNRWRVKPVKEENDAQIKERMKNYLKFFTLFLQDSHKRNESVVNWRGIPTIVDFYGNGIGMCNRDEISNSWMHCFYNESQAMQGYELLEKTIQDNYLHCKKTDDGGWVMLDACYMEGLYAAIK